MNSKNIFKGFLCVWIYCCAFNVMLMWHLYGYYVTTPQNLITAYIVINNDLIYG